MPHKKIIFLGSKPIGFDCLTYLIAKQAELGVEIAGIMTQPRKEFGDSHDLTALANANNIPVIDRLDNLPACDIIYSVQYHQILKPQHISKAAQVAVNLHMAPLPEYRGSNQFSFALIEGKTEFGTTIHVMDPRIDHGDILFQKRFKIPENCWVNELYELTFKSSFNLFKQTLGHIVAGNYHPVPQAALEAKFGVSLHYRNEINNIKKIDLNWPPEKIRQHIRATTMPGFEPPYFEMDGERIYFSKKY